MLKHKRLLPTILSLLLCLILCSCTDLTDDTSSEPQTSSMSTETMANDTAFSTADTSQTEAEQAATALSENEDSNLPTTDEKMPAQTEEEPMKETQFYIKANGTTFAADFADNNSADALRDLLHEDDLTIDMHDYGNFEKVGEIGHTLPQNNTQITTEPGDVILYLGTNITIYYNKNSWNFTRLGKIQNVTKKELLSVFGDGNVAVTFSLME